MIQNENNQNLNINPTNKEKLLFYEFMNFLEIFIHTVLYTRNVYPKEAFYSYSIYNLDLKFIVDDEINKYITGFLKNTEKLIFSRFIKKIYICIINPDDNTILEIFNLELDFADKFYDFEYSELCLNFKSILYKLWLTYINQIDDNKESNKVFTLCLESSETKVFANTKLFEEINQNIEENFVRNIFNANDNLLSVYQNREVCVILDDVNYTINISRNYC